MSSKAAYERFVWFDLRTRSKKYPNATSLANQFEVSTKTAQRDIEFMRDRLNCPLVYDKTRKGYLYEDASFSLPFTYLSSDELSSLLIARKLLEGISGAYISDELSTVIENLTSIIKNHTVDLDVVSSAVSLHLIEYSPVSDAVFGTVLEGCIKKRRLSFSYLSPNYDKESIRTVDPYHLFNYMGTWHLLAYCHMRKDLRDFNLNRMNEVKIIDQSFALMPGFDFMEYFDKSFGIYKGRSTKTVTLRFSPTKTKWIKGKIWHKDQKEKLLKNGSLELTFPAAGYFEVMMEVLKHGSHVKVIRPRKLKELIKSEARKILKLY